jgi:hypothetical protein
MQVSGPRPAAGHGYVDAFAFSAETVYEPLQIEFGG